MVTNSTKVKVNLNSYCNLVIMFSLLLKVFGLDLFFQIFNLWHV